MEIKNLEDLISETSRHLNKYPGYFSQFSNLDFANYTEDHKSKPQDHLVGGHLIDMVQSLD